VTEAVAIVKAIHFVLIVTRCVAFLVKMLFFYFSWFLISLRFLQYFIVIVFGAYQYLSFFQYKHITLLGAVFIVYDFYLYICSCSDYY